MAQDARSGTLMVTVAGDEAEASATLEGRRLPGLCPAEMGKRCAGGGLPELISDDRPMSWEPVEELLGRDEKTPAEEC